LVGLPNIIPSHSNPTLFTGPKLSNWRISHCKGITILVFFPLKVKKREERSVPADGLPHFPL